MSGAVVKVETLLEGHRLDTNQGSVAFCSVNLVEVEDGDGVVKRALVDTGHTGRRVPLQRALARRGLSCADVDVLVCTHAHWDHIENLDLFERARIVLHRDERRYLKRPHRNDFACPAWVDAVFDRFGSRIDEVEEGTEVLPGVKVIEAPGHSAGTIALAARTDQGTAVLTGDSVQNSTVAIEGRNALVFWDEALAARTIAKLTSIADVIYPGHDRPFRLIKGGGVEYLRPFQLTLLNVAPGEPGLEFDDRPPFSPVVMEGIEDQHW